MIGHASPMAVRHRAHHDSGPIRAQAAGESREHRLYDSDRALSEETLVELFTGSNQRLYVGISRYRAPTRDGGKAGFRGFVI
jgi:hypothetical protein